MKAEEIRKFYEYGGMYVEMVWRRPDRGEPLEFVQIVARGGSAEGPALSAFRPDQIESLSKLVSMVGERSRD